MLSHLVDGLGLDSSVDGLGLDSSEVVVVEGDAVVLFLRAYFEISYRFRDDLAVFVRVGDFFG